MPAQSINKAIVILAIGPLGLGNGLLKFKVLIGYKPFKLKSGEMLGALYNTPQIFKGCEGGIAYLLIWVRLVTAS